MPRVQFTMPQYDLKISKSMPSPKRFTETSSWLKQARKVIPEIPNVEQTDWYVWQETVTLHSVIFELHNLVGDKCAVVIDRTASALVA